MIALKDKMREAGIVGAGGAGFPSYAKLTNGIDALVVNGAECEPLLYTDYIILKNELSSVLLGISKVLSSASIPKALISIKDHTAKRLDLKDGEELADRIGKSRPAIANTLRLLNLSQEVIKMVANGNLSAGHARTLVAVPQYDQIKIAEQAVKEGFSVREIEKRVRDYFNPPEEKAKKKVKVELSAELKELIVDMQRVFGTRVNAIGNDKKGRIYIDYYTRDDLDRLSELLEFLKKSQK